MQKRSQRWFLGLFVYVCVFQSNWQTPGFIYYDSLLPPKTHTQKVQIWEKKIKSLIFTILSLKCLLNMLLEVFESGFQKRGMVGDVNMGVTSL